MSSFWNKQRTNVAAVLITLLGCSQMAGHMIGSKVLRGIGAAACVAPFPKVFSDVDGLETFASEFVLRGRDARGEPFVMPITPELYSQLEGCYNRRNVYGAALSYAPRMPEPLWSAVFCHGLAEGGPLRHEFGLPPGARDLSVEIRTRTRGRSDVWVLAPECAR